MTALTPAQAARLSALLHRGLAYRTALALCDVGIPPADLLDGKPVKWNSTTGQFEDATSTIKALGNGTSVPAPSAFSAKLAQGYAYHQRAADGGTSYSFPHRIRPPEPARRKTLIRNLGTTDVQVAATTVGSTSFNSPSGAQWTAGVVIPAGQQADVFGTAALFLRPNVSGQAFNVGVLSEMAAA